MNELSGLTQIGAAQKRMEKLVNPDAPVQSSVRKLEVQLDKHSAVTKEKKGFMSRVLKIPLQEFLTKLQNNTPDDPESKKNRQIKEAQKAEADKLNSEVGYHFKEGDTFNCTEYTEAVHFSVPTDQLLPSQHPEKLNRDLHRLATVTKADVARIYIKPESEVSDLELSEVKLDYELPPTTETIVRFYVHEVPDASDGMDLIIFGGGGSEALGNVGFAAQARDVLKDPKFKGKVRRIIILPHLVGSTRTATPVDPAHTRDFGPAADILLQALEQASIKLSDNICLMGHSAGANQAIMLADRLVDKQLNPRLVLLEPAIGENPKIMAEMISTGFTDPYTGARRDVEIPVGDSKETAKATTRTQALGLMFKTVMEGWGTTEGPARWGILKEVLRNPTHKPLPYMVSEAKTAGIGDDFSDANPVIDILANDTTQAARKKLGELGIPISITWVKGATVVDRYEERIKQKQAKKLAAKNKTAYQVPERDQAFFDNRAHQDFPNATVPPQVHVVEGINHFKPMWDAEVLKQAMISVLVETTN